jgi:hypothetical protein
MIGFIVFLTSDITKAKVKLDEKKSVDMSRPESVDGKLPSDVEMRYRRLEAQDIPDAAIERYLDQKEIDIAGISNNTTLKVAEKFSSEELEDLINEYKYAGEQSLNYYVVTGVSDNDFDELAEELRLDLPRSQEEVGIREPYFAGAEKLKGNLYLSFGYNESTKDTDPESGVQSYVQIRGRCVAVVRPQTDLVSIRCTDENMAKKVANRIGSALNIERDSTAYPPQFGHEFEERFRNELIEKYHTLKIRIDDQQGRTVNTIEYSAKTDEEGEKKDAREDSDVARQIDEHGGDIRMGYVELKNGSKFYMNRDKSKISFIKCESEAQINEITEVFDDVLRETGEYPQRKLEGLRNVPK